MYSMVLSILHRATGVFQSLGLLPLTWWLVALASGPEAYQSAVERFRSPLVQLLLLGWLFSFFYHFVNGIRHLAWDCGYGYERRHARASGWTGLTVAIALTLLCAVWILRARGWLA